VFQTNAEKYKMCSTPGTCFSFCHQLERSGSVACSLFKGNQLSLGQLTLQWPLGLYCRNVCGRQRYVTNSNTKCWSRLHISVIIYQHGMENVKKYVGDVLHF
jgi:hypothetical protein